MEQNNRRPLLAERGLDWLAAKAAAYRVPLLSSFVFGMLAYGFTFTNKLVNHDEVTSLFEKGGTLALGRWGLDILERIFPNFSMPWIYGLITVALIAVSVCCICHIFEIKNKLLQVLLGGSIVVFPSLISTLCYMFTSSSYAVAFLMAVLAVLLLQKKKPLPILSALGCMVFSLSIYQAYVALTAGLLIVVLIRQLLEREDMGTVLRRGLFYVAFLLISLVLYALATQLLMALTGRGFSGYAEDSMRITLADLPAKIATAYGSFFRFFLEGYRGLMPTAFCRVLHWILLGAMVVLLLLQLPKKDLPRLLLLAALLGVLPLAINCMYLLSPEDSVHTLVLYGFVSVYVLAAVLAETAMAVLTLPRLRALALEASTFAMALILISNIYTANTVSLKLYLRYQNAYAFYTALSADIQRMPGFDEDTKLAVIGNYPIPGYYFEHLGEPSQMTGTTGFLPSDYSKERFLTYYLGFPIPFAADEEISAIQSTPEFEGMPGYPYYGSIRFFGDILVVKLS